ESGRPVKGVAVVRSVGANPASRLLTSSRIVPTPKPSSGTRFPTRPASGTQPTVDRRACGLDHRAARDSPTSTSPRIRHRALIAVHLSPCTCHRAHVTVHMSARTRHRHTPTARAPSGFAYFHHTRPLRERRIRACDPEVPADRPLSDLVVGARVEFARMQESRP